MIKQRNEEQKALEKKRKEEVSIRGRPAAEIKEGQIAVEDIESKSSMGSNRLRSLQLDGRYLTLWKFTHLNLVQSQVFPVVCDPLCNRGVQLTSRRTKAMRIW